MGLSTPVQVTITAEHFNNFRELYVCHLKNMPFAKLNRRSPQKCMHYIQWGLPIVLGIHMVEYHSSEEWFQL